MLKRFEVAGVRNLQQTRLEFHPELNIVCGQNASGKTSLLEAISILASGKSFRTTSLENVLQHGSDQLRVFGMTETGDRVGYEWSRNQRDIRINGESVNRISMLAQALPLQSFVPDTHIEFSRSRKHRVAILDWVLFHVEQRFHENWSRYQRVLAQRNAALKEHQDPAIWDTEFIRLAQEIVDHRQSALTWLMPYIEDFGSAIPGGGSVALRLKRGWAQDKSLAQALQDDRDRDRRDGFTHSGAHRSDLEVMFDGHKAREEASQGQLKTLVMVLRLSQIQYFSDQTGRRSLFLLDDLPAELDLARRQQVMALLAKMPIQVFATSTEPGLIDLENWHRGHKLFHVEQGRLTPE